MHVSSLGTRFPKSRSSCSCGDNCLVGVGDISVWVGDGVGVWVGVNVGVRVAVAVGADGTIEKVQPPIADISIIHAVRKSLFFSSKNIVNSILTTEKTNYVLG
jgi:hypothetical protein